MKTIKPDYYYENIFTINYEMFKKKGIKVIVFDLDNTLAPLKDKIDQKTIYFLARLSKDFSLYILTNGLGKRIRKEELPVKERLYFALKPLTFKVKKIVKREKVLPKEVLMVGDQIYTDILTASKIGALSVLVDPLDEKDLPFTWINRIKEERLFKKLEQENLFKKGEYDK